MVGHGHQIPMEVVGTMIEIADVAWNAIEHRKERRVVSKEEKEISRIRLENQHLKNLLTETLSAIHGISQEYFLATDCPPDLYARLLAVVDNPAFVSTLESLNRQVESKSDSDFFCTKDQDIHDDLINDDESNLNRWVLVKHDMDLDHIEEASGIDNESYAVISEENVIDGIANFIGRCVLENPKTKLLSSQELHRAVTKALGNISNKHKLKRIWEAGKIIYDFTIWGIFLTGLYRHRTVVNAALKGATSSTKFVLKAF